MIYEALKKKGHQAILLDVYLGYEGDYEDIVEKNIDWAENIGGITESNPDISSIKALRKDGGKSFFGPGAVSYTHLDVYKRQERVILCSVTCFRIILFLQHKI